jgi:hypothetical protein
MRRRGRVLSLLLCLSVLVPAGSFAQTQTPPVTPPQAQTPGPPGSAQRLRVYLDCFDCFSTYLREEITWVDFVREVQDADVTILSNSQQTGGGGREVVLRFIGRGRLAGRDFELKAISLTGETENVRRENILRTVTVGLLHYLAGEGLPAGLGVEVDVPESGGRSAAPADDPWNLWVFSLNTGGSYNAEESNRDSSWRISASGDRVTEDWKISFGLSAENENETFNLDEEDEEPFEVRQRERQFNWFVAKSLGPHWSFGLEGSVQSSTFGNEEFTGRLAQAIEYSIFPYRDYATRQLVAQYEIGVEYARYNEVTLFGKLRETLGRHQIGLRLDQRQPWGSLEAGVEFSQYLHDFSKYRVEFDGEIDLRLARGFSVNFEANASRIRDQISLPSRGATPEEVLLRLRELQSGYEVGVSFGISYSFGSIFNNVVNPRFGNGGGGF